MITITRHDLAIDRINFIDEHIIDEIGLLLADLHGRRPTFLARQLTARVHVITTIKRLLESH